MKTYQCDSCGEKKPIGCVRTMMAYGCEGSFCCKCRGFSSQDCADVCDHDEDEPAGQETSK